MAKKKKRKVRAVNRRGGDPSGVKDPLIRDLIRKIPGRTIRLRNGEEVESFEDPDNVASMRLEGGMGEPKLATMSAADVGSLSEAASGTLDTDIGLGDIESVRALGERKKARMDEQADIDEAKRRRQLRARARRKVRAKRRSK